MITGRPCQSNSHLISRVILICFIACFLSHMVPTSAAEPGSASSSSIPVDASPTSQPQSDCDKSMIHIANVLFGFVSGEAALKVIREAVSMCPHKLDHRFTLVDHLLSTATADADETLNTASQELRTVMKMIVEASATTEGTDSAVKHHKDLQAVLTRWNRLDKVRADTADPAVAAKTSTTDSSSPKPAEVASTTPRADESTQQRDTNTFMTALVKELSAGASDDLSNVEKLPENLRLLWPLPFRHYTAERLMPFNSHLITLAGNLKQQIDEKSTPRAESSALKKGYSLVDTAISPSTPGEPYSPCSSQTALYSQFCESFVGEVSRALRSPLSIGDEKSSSSSTPTDVHIQLLRKPSLQLDETLDAHRPTHEGVWSNGGSQSSSAFSAAANLSACANEGQTECWSPPFLFTALYIISRPNDGLHPLAKDLTIDDELSFADPRVQAGMLSFTSSSATNPISGSFLAQGEPLRYSLGEGQLFIFPSWVSRSLAPNTSGRARIFSTMPMAVRFKYSALAASGQADSQHTQPRFLRPNPNSFFRWATPVYRSLLYQQPAAERSSASASDTPLLFSRTSFAKFNNQLRQGLLQQRAYQLAHKNWKIKSNRGGWHSSIDLLSNTPTLSPTADSPALQQALSQLKQMVLAHVAAYLRDVGEAACHPFMFHQSHDTCRAFPWRKLFQTKKAAAAKAAPPAGLGFLFGGGGGAAAPSQVDYHSLEELIDITQSWSVINLPGHYNMMHTHPDSIISGVYYVSLGRNGNTQGSHQGTNVHFRNPLGPMRSLHSSDIRLPHQWIEPFASSAAEKIHLDGADDDSDDHTDVFEVVQEGKLLMFPAWLEHYVIPHRAEQEAAINAHASAPKGECSQDADAIHQSECIATKVDEKSAHEANIDDLARICIAFNVHFK